MSNIAKLRHQLQTAQVLAKAHINFMVIPIIDATDEPFLARLQADRLEELARKAEEE